MAKKSNPTHRKKLPPIAGVRQEVVTYLLNAAFFGEYHDCCLIEDLAGRLKRQPSRFRPTINRLVKDGYLEVTGKVLEMVYPTVAALRHQDRQLSEAEAEKIIKRLKHSR